MAGRVEQIEDRGLVDAETAPSFTDADPGIVLDESVPAHLIEQTPPLVAVYGFGTRARGLTDQFAPLVFEKVQCRAVGVMEKVIGAGRSEGREDGARGLPEMLRGARRVRGVHEIAAEKTAVVGKNKFCRFGGVHDLRASSRRNSKLAVTPFSPRCSRSYWRKACRSRPAPRR